LAFALLRAIVPFSVRPAGTVAVNWAAVGSAVVIARDGLPAASATSRFRTTSYPPSRITLPADPITPGGCAARPALIVTVIGSAIRLTHCWAARLNAFRAGWLEASPASGTMSIRNEPRFWVGGWVVTGRNWPTGRDGSTTRSDPDGAPPAKPTGAAAGPGLDVMMVSLKPAAVSPPVPAGESMTAARPIPAPPPSAHATAAAAATTVRTVVRPHRVGPAARIVCPPIPTPVPVVRSLM
jgi:hypothetical protein